MSGSGPPPFHTPTPLRVLLVEHDPADREMCLHELARAGFEVTPVIAERRQEVEALLNAGPYDLVLSDYQLPGFTGLDVLAAVRERGDTTPFILLSGTIGEEIAVETLRLGATDYVLKDRLGRLAVVVRRALAERADRDARTRAESALRDSEARYRLLFEHNPYPMWVLDTETLKFLAVNDAAIHQYGFTLDEFMSMSVLDIRPPADIPAFLESMAVPRHGVRLTSGWRHVRKDGSQIDVEVSSHAIVFGDRPALLALVMDVSERKRAERALRESEERFRQMAEHIKEAFFVTEIPTGRPLYISPTWAEIWGRPVADAYAHPQLWFESIHPDDRAHMSRSLEAGQRGESSVDQFRIIRPDRSQRWVRARAFPVRDESGKVYRVVGVVEDITDLRRAEEQATQAQKMEAVGRLAGGIAHDFNNILTVILGEVELLVADTNPQGMVLDSLNEVKKAGERAATLTRQLLAFSRRQLIEPVVFDLNGLVIDMGKMLKRLIGEDIETSVRISQEPLSVRADRGQIEQVLANLVVNARDAMPRGGTLTLETARVILDEEYVQTHLDAAVGSHIMLAVSDTGTGMTAEVKARIFEPFFTTKESGKGTGLGLATSFGIVKQAGGHLAVYSEPGLGTTIRVYLPAIAGEESELVRSVEGAIPKGTETILVVEDDSSVRGIAVRTLEGQGYRVLEATDGPTAIAILDTIGEQVDLLFTDVVLPTMGGRELAERVRSLRPNIKVLFASGYTDDVILQHKLIDHDITFLQKPYSRESLSRKIRTVLDREV